jgi:hypothetical protein
MPSPTIFPMSLPFLATKDELAKLKAALTGAMWRMALFLSCVLGVGAATVVIVGGAACPSS